ncbi:Arsenite efflux pump ACR3-related permease [Thermoplasmatales archaeon BRNA1]|nr:Arsenite efflux pump ACR3-related permease [Thermoplasmatales archaeon BRNA1]
MIAAALAGLGLGTAFGLDDSASWAIEPFLVIMLFSVFLAVDFGDMRRSFDNRSFFASAVIINFVWTPVLAYVLGLAFFDGSLDMRIGLIMLLVTPCTDWYLVFTSVAKGNVPMSSSLLPINLILQILLLPVYIKVFAGEDSSFDMLGMFLDMWIVLIPFAAAFILKAASGRNNSARSVVDGLNSRSDGIQLAFLCMAIAVMFAAESTELFDNFDVLLESLMPLAIFFAVNYCVSTAVYRAQNYPYADGTSLIFTTLARNSPLALAIAVMAFPDRPLIMLVLVIGPLIELPILSLVASLRLRGNDAQNAG